MKAERERRTVIAKDAAASVGHATNHPRTLDTPVGGARALPPPVTEMLATTETTEDGEVVSESWVDAYKPHSE